MLSYQKLTEEEEDSWRAGTVVGWWKPPLLDEVPAVTKLSMIIWQREKGVHLCTGLSHFQSSVCVNNNTCSFGSVYVLLCTQMKRGKPESMPPNTPLLSFSPATVTHTPAVVLVGDAGTPSESEEEVRRQLPWGWRGEVTETALGPNKSSEALCI